MTLIKELDPYEMNPGRKEASILRVATSSKIQNSFILLTQYIFLFCVDLNEQTAIISLYKIKGFDFTPDTERVYCTVLTV
jgi:hypothetical protein